MDHFPSVQILRHRQLQCDSEETGYALVKFLYIKLQVKMVESRATTRQDPDELQERVRRSSLTRAHLECFTRSCWQAGAGWTQGHQHYQGVQPLPCEMRLTGLDSLRKPQGNLLAAFQNPKEGYQEEGRGWRFTEYTAEVQEAMITN